MKNIPSKFQKRLFFAGISLALILAGCGLGPTSQDPGGGSDTEIVQGQITDPTGKALTRAIVSFYDVNSNPSLPAGKIGTAQAMKVADYIDTTDENGEYSFSSIDSGLYNMEAVDEKGENMAFRKSIHITNNQPRVLTDTLRPPGRIVGTVLLPGRDNHTGTFVYVGGSGYIVFTSDSGKFTMPRMPQGSYNLTLLPKSEDFKTRIIENVKVVSDSTTNIGMVLVNRDESGPPSRPEGVTASYDTLKEEVVLSWLKNVETDVVGYIVKRRHIDSTQYDYTSHLNPDTFAVQTQGNGLVIGESYVFQVIAEDSEQRQSEASKRDTVTIVSKALVLAPDSVWLFDPENVGSDSLVLRWTQSKEPDFKHYVIYTGDTAKLDSMSTIMTTITAVGETTYTVKGLTQNTSYSYAVSVSDTTGWSALGNTVTAKTANASPEKVSLESLEFMAGDSLKIVWTKSTEADFQAYRIYFDTASTINSSDSLLAEITDSKDTIHVAPGFDTTKTYYLAVVVVDQGGLWGASNVKTTSPVRLTSLEISHGVLSPGFSGETVDYAVTVESSTDTVSLTPVSANAGDVILVNTDTVSSGSSQKVGLKVGENEIMVSLFSSGRTMSYRVKVIRKDLTLASLALTIGTFTPAFCEYCTEYAATTKDSTVKVTAEAGDTNAVIAVNGSVVASGSQSAAISLSKGSNTVTVIVRTANGALSRSYTITITRVVPSSNADLKGLYLQEITISPSFHADSLKYAALAASDLASVTVVATTSDSNATIKVNGVEVSSGNASSPIALSAGTNLVNVSVAAEDSTTSRTYGISITKAAATKGLIALWNFDSTKGSAYFDASGNGYHAISTDVGIGTGVNYSALELGNDVFDLKIPNSEGEFNFGKFSIVGWIKSSVRLDSAAGPFVNYRKIFNYATHSSGVAKGYSFNINDKGNLQLYVANENGSDWVYATSSNVLQKSKWYHVGATYDGAVMRVFLNGDLVHTKAHASSIPWPEDDARIGCRVDQGGSILQRFKGKIDELALYDYALSSGEVRSKYLAYPVPRDSIVPDTLAHWKFDDGSGSTLTDHSGNGHHGTIYGATWSTGVSGNALDFDGVNDYVVVPENDAFDNLRSLTIETWVRAETYGSSPSYMCLTQKWGTGGVSDDVWSMTVFKSSNRLTFQVADGSVGMNTQTSGALQLNQWVHLVGTWDGDTARIYRNGVLENARPFKASELNNNSNPVYIGRGTPSYQEFTDGRIDEMRILNFALTPQEVLARFNSFTIPPEPGNLDTIAHWKFNEGSGTTLTDHSGNGHHGTITGGTWETGVEGNALFFDGVDDYVMVPHHSDFTNVDALTVEAWVRPTSYGTDNTATIVSKWGPSGMSDDSWSMGTFKDQLNRAKFHTVDGVSLHTPVYSQEAPPLNSWTYLVGVWTPDSSFIYRNGNLDASVKNNNSSIGKNSPDVYIGRGKPSYQQFFHGRIDEIRILSNRLTSSQIAARYLSFGFPVNTTSGLAAYYPFNGNPNDHSGNANHGTSTGAVLTADRFGNANSAYDFSGATARISVPHSSSLSMSGDITYSGWSKWNTVGTNHDTFIEKGLHQSSNRVNYLFGWFTDGQLKFTFSSSTFRDAKETSGWWPTVGQWYHICTVVKKAENRVLFYVDGDLKTDFDFSPWGLDYPTNTDELRMGINTVNTEAFDGSLDDIRIYGKALSQSEIQALYTENGWTGN